MTFIKDIKKDNSITLYKYTGKDLKISSEESYFNDDNYAKVCVVDLETTGLDFERDQIVEIGLQLIAVNRNDYKEVKNLKEYESYNDTNLEIDEEITQLTGITKQMIEGKSIEWSKVEEIFSSSDIIVAHNALFDRHFLEKNIDFSNVWACSKSDIDWKKRGFLNTKLELLCVWHGFFYDAHRAMNDVAATTHLLIHPSYGGDPPLKELVENSQKKHHLIINRFPYNETFIKLIKKRGGYRYNPKDKSWRILLKEKDLLDLEVEWLQKNIYNGYFQGDVREISLFDKYKL